MNQYKFTFSTLVAFLTGLMLLGSPLSVQAGCGCDKPPPAPASVRPNVTYGGMPVTLFHSSLVTGQLYDITFTAMNGQTSTVLAQAVNRRDLADGVYKNQLVVTVPPTLALGPASLTVKQAGQTGALLSIPDTSFTVAPQPIVVASQPGSYNYQNYRAAVGRDGRVYLSLDVTGITQPRTFKAQAKGWPLRFTKDDTVFYNTQGFLMQLANAPIPGLFSINSGSSTDSDIAQYARHEFNTYFLQHAEHLPHSTDPTDGHWHLDGTRHVDHNHLILTLAGTVNNSVPAPGASPTFTLSLNTYSFFENGLVGADWVFMDKSTSTDSYSPRTGLYDVQGDVLSNGQVQLTKAATIKGDATAGSFNISGNAQVAGTKTLITQSTVFMPVSIPTGLVNLGALNVSSSQTRTLGPGSYQVSDLVVGGQLFIDNSRGPVTLYVTGYVDIPGMVTTADQDPEKLAVYVAGSDMVRMWSGEFHGVLYAPQSPVQIVGLGQFYGAFVGKTMRVSGSSQVHYDTALRGQ